MKNHKLILRGVSFLNINFICPIYCDVMMNPFYNPFFLLKILKSYLRDIDRLDRFSEEKLHLFQDKQKRGPKSPYQNAASPLPQIVHFMEA